ncbi:hypothetical protein A1O3_06082 [Capronia epimyces CBS 606.96]|uniref:Xylanolytic transcriptional activator regulatory domain-containing protein n=1 Tax=Capronia epimyces CBS 606.96 TaxID=1182542 RepID=W9YIZ6_9EURO|nr:uncharacterized protein A1O3_06082 [Capronia epimyces CBS 606.96]EXJ82269.1 hypothetical protein A1O3_06082 [Capronia epimyces CBS 606.96]
MQSDSRSMTDHMDCLEVEVDNAGLPALPPLRVMRKIFDAFFEHIYPIPVFSFLHRASLLQLYQSGRADQGLLFAIIALTVLLTDVDAETGVSASRYMDFAQGPVLQQLERPSVTKLQVLVLAIRFRGLIRQRAMAFMLLPTATRMAYILRLNYENPERSAVARESNRRLMWSVFTLDGMMSGGLPDFRLCAPETLHIQLPCNEENFELGVDETTPDLETSQSASGQFPANTGLVALYIRISWMRSRILQHTKRVVAARSHDTEEIERSITSLGRDLAAIAACLPAKYVFSANNLRLRAFSSRLSAFVLFHLWWHQCHCDLFRIALSGLREALPQSTTQRLTPEFVSHCRRQCFDHGASIIEIFTTLQSLPIDSLFLDWDSVACAYQSARYLFYGFQSDSQGCGMSAGKVKSSAAVCLSVVQGRYLPHQITPEKTTDLATMVERDLSNTSAVLEDQDSNRCPRHGDRPTDLSPASQQILSHQSIIFDVNIQPEGDEVAIPPTLPQCTPRMKMSGTTTARSGVSTSGQEIPRFPEFDHPIDFSSLQPDTSVFDALFDESMYHDLYGFDNMAWFSEQSWTPGSNEDPCESVV